MDPSVVNSPCTSNSIIGKNVKQSLKNDDELGKRISEKIRSIEDEIDDLYKKYTSLMAGHVKHLPESKHE